MATYKVLGTTSAKFPGEDKPREYAANSMHELTDAEAAHNAFKGKLKLVGIVPAAFAPPAAGPDVPADVKKLKAEIKELKNDIKSLRATLGEAVSEKEALHLENEGLKILVTQQAGLVEDGSSPVTEKEA